MPNRLLERLGADFETLTSQYETILNRCADDGRDPSDSEIGILDGLRSQMAPLGERIIELRQVDDARMATVRAMTDPSDLAGEGRATSLLAGSGAGAQTQRHQLPPLQVPELQLRSFIEALNERKTYNEPLLTTISRTGAIENRAPVVTPSGATVPFWLPPVMSGVEPRLAERISVREAGPANTFDYLAVTAPAVLAAVAEGAPKPDSGLTVGRRSAPIVKGAAYSDVSWEMVADFDSVEALVNVELQSGLIRYENLTIVTAIRTDPGVLTPTPSSTSPLISIFQAKQGVRANPNVGLPDLVIIHPIDFAAVAAELASTSGMLLGGEQAVTLGPAETLWGMGVAQTIAATPGQVLLGVAQDALFALREGPRLLVDMYSQSTNNLNRIILEERFAAGVANPGRWAKFTLPGGATTQESNGGRAGGN